jgi:ComF family protein
VSGFLQTLRNGAEGLLRLVYPPACALCGGRLEPPRKLGLCPECWRGAPLIRLPYCTACGQPLNADEVPGGLCLDCRLEAPPVVLRAAALYREPLVSLLHLCKFDFWAPAAEQLAELLVERAHALFPAWRPDALVPVPLHHRRLRWRGFNQSVLLARILAEHWELPVTPALRRVRDTVPQARLPREARLTNLRGAFAVVDPQVVLGARLLLIDDVTTSGGTVHECARTLSAAGAAEVRAYLVARS